MSSPADPSTPAWGTLVRNTALVVVVIALIWVAFHVRLPDLETLRGRLEAFGFWSGAAFTALYAVVAVTPIPVTVMALTAGVLFGAVEGSLYSVAGAMLGSAAAYGLARLLGKETALRMLGRHRGRVEEQMEGAGFLAVLTLRVAPGLPYWPVNYGAGALGVPFGTFASASTLGSLPGQVALVAVGAFAAQPSVLTGAIVGTAWLVVLGMTVWGLRRWRAARRELADDAVPAEG
ncbi:TVP38/TMEM64 family protein [Micrococcus sp.]|uniref:TVP38/TMEM64 family protein n=1 Tax=Micrococcus sp. TaxID=1271 RepID=UPI0026DABAE0|nr:TVP38/TMEM64 family protein [Micrococcus sp.]MDO4238738.1 TVP38/TMEM64 family protein [Micrococcus sp.]